MRLLRRSLRLLAATVSVAVFAACVAFAGLNYAGFRSARCSRARCGT